MFTPGDKPPIVSSQVDWYPVHLYAKPLLESVGFWPMIGTLAWQDLPDDHPAKIAAMFDAARHWALRVNTAQEAFAEASRAVSAANDWISLSHRVAFPSSARIPRSKDAA